MPHVLVLVRHAAPLVSPTVPRAQWPLTDAGAAAAHRLGAELGDLARGVPILSSTERKAIDTATCLSAGVPVSAPVSALDELCEIDHPWSDDASDHRRHALEYLAGADVAGWEPRPEAVARFDRVVESSTADRAVIVTHGIVLSAWLGARVAGVDAPSFWRSLGMPDAWVLDLRAGSLARP